MDEWKGKWMGGEVSGGEGGRMMGERKGKGER